MRFKELKFGLGLLFRRPFNCLLQLTNRCNMRCSFCDFWPHPAKKNHELSLADYQRLSQELGAMGTFLVSIEGGEPLLRPDLVEIVFAMAQRHIPTLFSNGWYITPDKARELFDAGLDSCCISIDYPQPEQHDAKRDLPGAFDKAWQAVDHLVAAAPRGGKQVHVISVLMEDNWRELEALLQLSRARGVGHQVTLLSTTGYRRGRDGPDRLPGPEAASHLQQLWRSYPHLRYFQEYFQEVERFLRGSTLEPCRAGQQTFNIDHIGNVSPCIEKIDWVCGNIKEESLLSIHARMKDDRARVSGCQDCYTACRGISQALGQGGTWRSWRDLVTRLNSH